MFENPVIVQSAISAFNNAALSAPSFLWTSVLALPIFWLTHKHGDKITELLKWNQSNIVPAACKWLSGLTLAWIVLFSGNYDVLRDSRTLLTFVIAFIVFLTSFCCGKYTQSIKLPKWKSLTQSKQIAATCIGLLALFLVGLSNTHTWWGPIVQITVFTCGLYCGRQTTKHIAYIPASILIMFTIIIAILMQPEFFRFGQLGNLSPLHLICIWLFGLFATVTLALRNVKPQSKIRQSAYTKLKWMARALTVFCTAMFILTESVPFFVATCLMLCGIFWLSIVHAKTIPANLDKIMFFIAFSIFGIITTMPVITCMGILGIQSIAHPENLNESKFLL